MRYRWLLAPLLALAVLGAAPHNPPLPELPNTVYSRYGPVPVTLVKVVVCPDSSGTTPPRIVGCYTSGGVRTIQIADTLSLWWKHFVLGHEVCHVAMRDVGATFDVRSDEEKVCWIMGRYRVGELEGHP